MIVTATSAISGGARLWSSWQRASAKQTFVVLGSVAAGLVAVQSLMLFPLVDSDPQLADLPDGVALRSTFWVLRLAIIVLAPVILALRVVSVSLVLRAILAVWGVQPRAERLLRGVLRAEGVFLVESACATLVLVRHAPSTLRDAEALSLHAGLDLFWQPASSDLASLLVAANLFALLWTLEIHHVIRESVPVNRGGARLLAVLFGALLVFVRSIALRL